MRDITTQEWPELMKSANDNDQTVIALFTAPWCPHCRRLGPVADKVANEAPHEVVFVKVDTDGNPALAQEWGIQGIPAMVRIEKGEEIGRLIGNRPESDIKQFAYSH